MAWKGEKKGVGEGEEGWREDVDGWRMGSKKKKKRVGCG
jgi:hypothetical protein